MLELPGNERQNVQLEIIIIYVPIMLLRARYVDAIRLIVIVARKR